MKNSNHYDVLIIGGGVIGLACAHYLQAAGRRVRILEKDHIGDGASHGNCGLIFTSDLVPLCAPGVIRKELLRMLKKESPLYINPAINLPRLLWLLRFAGKCNPRHVEKAVSVREGILRKSAQLYHDLFSETEIDCEWENVGVLLVYKDTSAMLKYRETNDLLAPFGMAARMLSRDELLEMEPALREDVCGAWHHTIESHLRPDRLMSGWRSVMLQRGVEITENCIVHRLIREKDQITGVVTDHDQISAEHYVLSAGAWSPLLTAPLKIHLPVQPGKGYSITMARPSRCPARPCYFLEKSVVATPWQSGYRLGGTMEFSGWNTRMRPARLKNLVRAAREYLKEPVGEPILEEWVGMRPMTYDDLPIIGRVTGCRNLILATGHGMTGLSMAPSTGKLVTQLISGKPPHIDPTPFGLSRFETGDH